LAEHISGNNGMVIAEARYKVAENGGGAEFALSVADQFHGLGLGKLLLDRLVCAASRAGLDRLVGETLPPTTACSAWRARPVLLSRPIRSTCTS
jgi:GNAT superfamily N-acetyltransferase